MIKTLLIILLWAVPCLATPLNLTVSYDIDAVSTNPGPYSATSDRSWTTFDQDDLTASGGANGPAPVAPHLNAVQITVDGQPAGAIIDNPGHRTVTVTADTTNPRPKVRLNMVWIQGPWLASHTYALGDKISVFKRDLINPGPEVFPAIPNTNGYWLCTRAGMSGATEPIWVSAPIVLTDASKPFLDSEKLYLYGDVVDNLDGTVNLPVLGIPIKFIAGDMVTITGTTNYNGNYTLPAQTNADANHITITHTYVAETLASPGEVHLTAAEAVDNGDGTVSIPVPSHGFIAGDQVTITGTVNYNADYTLPAQTLGDADHLVVTATYVAEVFDQYDYVSLTNGNIIDNGDGTVTIPAPAHGLVAGDVVDISGLVNYTANPYTLPAQTLGDADHFVITSAYIPEAIDAWSYANRRVQDPDIGGVEWQYTSDHATTAVTSHSTGRIIVKDNGNGEGIKTGVTYLRRSAP